MPQIEAKSKVLESDPQALFGEEPQAGEDESFVDLDAGEMDEGADAPAAPAKKIVAKKPVANTPAAEDDVPAEYKGKTPAELIRMHKEAQSLIGRQGSELGEFRKKADMLINASLADLQARRAATPPPAKAAEEPIDDSAIFAKPVDSISKLIENHPLIKEIRETLGKNAADREVNRASIAAEKFNAAHPDAPQILQDPDFQKWISGSRVRTQLLQRAHQKYDYEAGNEVFGTWKELKAARAPAKSETVADDTGVTDAAAAASAAGKALAAARKAKALDAAAAPTGGGGSTGGTKKKIYRRADVLRLMETDPARYEQLADEIRVAYTEGRVK